MYVISKSKHNILRGLVIAYVHGDVPRCKDFHLFDSKLQLLLCGTSFLLYPRLFFNLITHSGTQNELPSFHLYIAHPYLHYIAKMKKFKTSSFTHGKIILMCNTSTEYLHSFSMSELYLLFFKLCS